MLPLGWPDGPTIHLLTETVQSRSWTIRFPISNIIIDRYVYLSSSLKLPLSRPSYSSLWPLGLTYSSVVLSPVPCRVPTHSPSNPLFIPSSSLCPKTRQRPERLRDRPCLRPGSSFPSGRKHNHHSDGPDRPQSFVLISVPGCERQNLYVVTLGFIFHDRADWEFRCDVSFVTLSYHSQEGAPSREPALGSTD